jgi:hypothetical protein
VGMMGNFVVPACCNVLAAVKCTFAILNPHDALL